MAKVVRLPVTVPDADEREGNAERTRRLFSWASALLRELGIDKVVALAKTIHELHRITLDVEAAEVAIAIRDALHPASGKPAKQFQGLRAGALKAILRNRLADLKKDREATLRKGRAGERHRWEDELHLDAKGEIKGNLANLILILKESPKWKGVVACNELSACVVIRRSPPWGAELPDTPWNDHYDFLTRVWFQDQQINPAAGDVGRAVQVAAKANLFHPVREYYASLVWDGVNRLDTWLVDYFHAEDTPYIRAIGPRWPISAVARIYEPGCKVDHALVLEGSQGRQKSEALRTLAIRDDWFTDRLSHLATKDAAIEVAGVLIVELAELDALTRATSSTTKSFLTRRIDPFRPPYGKHLIKLRRQCVFAGTINPPASGGYLKDLTGARRYWPVACNGRIDRAGLEQVRDQLWAEAVQRFKNGEKWWLETDELEALATTEQEKRLVVDAWQEPIVEWLGDRTDVAVTEVLRHALGVAKTQISQNRVVKILKHLGFERYRARTKEAGPKGGRQNRYYLAK